MKKLKILPSILMLVLCVGVLAIGVFALAPTENSISGTITINSSNPEFKIQVYKTVINSNGNPVETKEAVGGEYTVRSGTELKLGTFEFDIDEANTDEDINKFKFEFEVTSAADENLGMYFSKDTTPTPSATTENVELEGGLVVGEVSKYNFLPKNGTATSTLTFSLTDFPTSPKEIDLTTGNISFNIVDLDSDLVSAEYVTSQNAADLNYVVMFPSEGSDTLTAEDYEELVENLDEAPGKLIIPGTVKEIEAYAFEDNSDITSVISEEGVETIGEGAFYGCLGITELVIPDSVTEIQGSAFEECYKLANLNLGNSVTYIGVQAFMKCAFESIHIPGSVAEIDTMSIHSCDYLKSVEFGEGVLIIGDTAFAGCTYLESVKFPDTLTTIAFAAFDGTNLYGYIGSPSNPYLYLGRTNGEITTINPNTKFIGTSAFENHKNIQEIVVPNGVVKIGCCAFYDSSLTSITILKVF